MKIYQIFTQSALRNFSYIIASEKGGKVLCIDPFDGQQIEKILMQHNLKLDYILNTHEHWDHHQGNAALVKSSGAKVMAHATAAQEIAHVDRLLKADDHIIIDENHYLKTLDTPGHTFAHVCFLLFADNRPVGIFTGDTLFNAGVGNCHNGGDPEVLFETIQRDFQDLAADIKVYPGHEYLENNLKFTLDREKTNSFAAQKLHEHRQFMESHPENVNGYNIYTMGDEREVNIFLRRIKRRFRRGFCQQQGEMRSVKETFLRLRELRNKW